MDFKIIGVVKYKEIKALIDKIRIKPKIEKRGSFFKKETYYTYISSDEKYSLAFKYKGEFLWGPKFYNLTLETRENNNIVLKKDFGDRIFVCKYYESNYPWADFCNKFYLLEIEERPDNKSSNFIKIYDADNNIETVVAENGWDILAWSKNAVYIIYKIYNNDNTVDVAVNDLFNKKTININKELHNYGHLVFFDKDEKYIIIIIERDIGVTLKIFTLADVNLIYSQDVNFRKFVLPLSKFYSFFIKKNKFFDINKPWFTVEFDKNNNVLYFGIQKEGCLWGEDYYDRLLWLKAELEF